MRKHSLGIQMLTLSIIVCVLSILGGAVLAQDEPDLPEPEVPVIDISKAEDAPLEPDDIPDAEIPVFDIASSGSTVLYPVIVRLRPDQLYRPESDLDGVQEVLDQRAMIDSAQADVLQVLAGGSYTEVHRFETIPYMSLQVDAAAFAQLQNHPRVEAVIEDSINELYTYHSNEKVGAPTAWQAGFEGTGYAVAIIDTGIDANHPAFAGGKVVQEACFTTNAASSDFQSGCPGGVENLTGPGAAAPYDPVNCSLCYHGTHVSGIAAGNGGQLTPTVGQQVTFKGVAPGANIIAINVFSIRTSQQRPGAFDSDVLQGLEHVYLLATDGPDGNPATDDALDIAAVNMSLGGSAARSTVCDGGGDPGYQAIADQLRGQGIATIAASGNSGFKNAITSPACYSSIIAVGATTVEASDPVGLAGDDDTVAFFSNSSELVDLLAPGFFVTSSVPVGTGTDGGNWRTQNGTSMASPYVAGAWAIMRQRFPDASVEDILEHLVLTGKPITDNGQQTSFGSSNGNGVTKPRIQLDVAINLATPILLEPDTITFSTQPALKWQAVPLAERYDVTLYDAQTNAIIITLNDIRPCDNAGICSVGSGTALEVNKRYYWTVQAERDERVTSPAARAEFTVLTIAPEGNIITGLPSYIFKPAADVNVTRYEVNVLAADNTVLFTKWYDETEICNTTACVVDTGLDLSVFIGNRSMKWTYRTAVGETINPVVNGPYEFTILAPVTPGPISAIRNIQGKPTFIINELTNDLYTADWYRLLVYDVPTASVVADEWVNKSDAKCNNGVCVFEPSFTLNNGADYFLFVSAYTSSLKGYSTWSSGLQFTVDVPAPSAAWLQLAGVYDDVLFGMTSTTRVPCERVEGVPQCSTRNVTFEIAYDRGGYSGDLLQILVWNNSTQEIIFIGDIFLRGEENLANVHCTDESCFIELSTLGTADYYWFVRSIGPGGPSEGGIVGYTEPGDPNEGDPNDLAFFRVEVPGESLTNLAYGLTPTLFTFTEPINGEVIFQWDHEPSAAYYNLIVTDPDALPEEGEEEAAPVVDAWYQVGVDIVCADMRCKIVTGGDFENGRYDWSVRYWNGSVSSDSDSTLNLNVPRPVAPELAGLRVFVDETITDNTSPIFEWPHVQNATAYEVYVQTADGEQIHYKDYRAFNICDGIICRIGTDELVYDVGNYEWYLHISGPGGEASGGIAGTGWIGPAEFSIGDAAPGVPVPLTPSNVTLNYSTPSFAWRPADNASWYRLNVFEQFGQTSVIDTWLYMPRFVCTTIIDGEEACVISPNIAIANSNNYAWNVTAYGSGGLGQPSNNRFFAVDAPLSEVVNLVAPADGALLVNDTVFRWEMTYADYYGLVITDQDGNQAFFQWYPKEEITCEAGFCEVSLPPGTLAGGDYSWEVWTWVPANGTIIPESESRAFTKL